MRRRAAGLVLALAGVTLTGCVMPTPYQPAADGHGYTDRALEDDRIRVTFSGNSVTPRETVEDYLLFRAAEVTLAHGCDYFIVVDHAIERSTAYRSTGTEFGGGHHSFHSSHHGHPFGFGAFVSVTHFPEDRYTGFANVVLRAGEKPSDDHNAYDARAVVETLAPVIVRPEADTPTAATSPPASRSSSVRPTACVSG